MKALSSSILTFFLFPFHRQAFTCHFHKYPDALAPRCLTFHLNSPTLMPRHPDTYENGKYCDSAKQTKKGTKKQRACEVQFQITVLGKKACV